MHLSYGSVVHSYRGGTGYVCMFISTNSTLEPLSASSDKFVLVQCTRVTVPGLYLMCCCF